MTDRINDLKQVLIKCVETKGWNSADNKYETIDFCYDNEVTRAEAEQLHKDKGIFYDFRDGLFEILNDEDDSEYDGYKEFKFADERSDDDDDWIDWYYEDRKLREDDKR